MNDITEHRYYLSAGKSGPAGGVFVSPPEPTLEPTDWQDTFGKLLVDADSNRRGPSEVLQKTLESIGKLVHDVI